MRKHLDMPQLGQAVKIIGERKRDRVAGWALLSALVASFLPAIGDAQPVEPAARQNLRLDSVVIDLLETAPLPPVLVSPTRRFALLVEERGLLPLQTLAQPVLDIGPLRVNPRTYGPHAPLGYIGLTLVDLESRERIDIPLPPNVTLGFPRWSPDGLRFAFTVTNDRGIELWVGEPRQRRAHRVLGPILNATTGNPCSWMPDGRRLLCRTVPRSRRSADPLVMSNYRERGREPAFASPVALSNGVVAQLLESQLILVDVLSAEHREIGVPSAFESVEPAPSGAYFLVRRMTSPYSALIADAPPRRALEIWDIAGRPVHSFAVEPNAPAGARGVHWHPLRPATAVWAQGSEDGDRVVMKTAPFVGDPLEIFRPDGSFAGMMWLDGMARAIVRDFDPQTRRMNLWLVTADKPSVAPRLLDGRSVDSPLSTAFMPAMHLDSHGETVVTTHNGGIYLRNGIADGNEVRHALEFLDLETRKRTLLWESAEGRYEPIVDLLSADGGAILVRRESADEPPNYIVHDLGLGTEWRISDNHEPVAGRALDAQRIPLRYRRQDGRQLSAVLYVPQGADPGEPPPVVMWAYPREFGTEASFSGVLSPERYLDFRRAFRLFFLLRGYAVMDEVSMPIVGEPGQANDSFIEQVVDNASAALGAAAATGLVNTRRAGIAGHSYGAFMVANLLAHSRLFEAGVAMSGAYNRTLTPYGFQTERRSLWDARDLYLAMSPFLYSNQIEAPLLLVHGLRDDNAGTQPIQSEQFYNAIRYNGGRAELLLLPFEGHNYRSRESVLQTADAMLGWFDRYLKDSTASRLGDGQVANADRPIE
jgi:dipeptidyl aminopeptidase/acylaminoacyl peptidase